MEVAFHGVRGSIPVPGPETQGYGGNTSCACVRTAAGGLIILDAGTGIIPLGRALMVDEFGRGEGEAAILLTHAHWDHIQGFPFFPPVFVAGNHFTLFGPGRSPAMLEGILEGQMNPHFSPLHTMRNLGATIELVAVEGDRPPFTVCGAAISGHQNPHGSTTALAYRVEADGRRLVYAPDAGYAADDIPDAAIDFYRGADVLIHDATYRPEDWEQRRSRGSSSIREAVVAAVRAGVAHLVLTHFDPDYSDEVVDSLVAHARRMLDEGGGAGVRLTAAAEGLSLPL